MRHFLLSGAISTLACGMGATAAMRVLIATAGSPYRMLACLRRASSGAVAIAPITVAAHKHRGAAACAQVASSGDIHWHSGPMERVDGDVRFVKYYAGNVATIGAAGRGIGTDLAVGADVAPAFPPASRLSTPSPMLALPSGRPSRLFVRPLQFTLTRPSDNPSHPTLPRFACQTIDCFAIHPPQALLALNRKTGISMPENQKTKSHPTCACLPPTKLIAAGFPR